MMKILHILYICLSAMFIAGCCTNEPPQFDTFFVWGLPKDADMIRVAAECGVTDGTVSTKEQRRLARQYGIRTYLIFMPPGRKKQVLLPEGTKIFDELSTYGGLKVPDDKASPDERRNFYLQRERFFRERGYHHGGEPEANRREVLIWKRPCLNDPDNLAEAKDRLKKLCQAEDIDGIAFDFVGYNDFHGCHCELCESLCRAYLKEHGLDDTPDNRNRYFLNVLVNYNNMMTAYVRQLRPDLRIASHLYPVFLPEPLYGKYLNFDLCGETAAWYYIWPDEKIAAYTRKIVANKHGMPFIGWYDTDKPEYMSFDHKSPERLAHEMQIILDNGGRSLMLCSPDDLFPKEEYRAVLRKYMRKARK